MLNTVPEPTGTTTSVSICILTANRLELLQKLISALSVQIAPGDEIIVLDTDPDKRNEDVLRSFGLEQLRYYPQKFDHFDFATARNKLLSLASRNYVVFIDDDAIPFPTWLTELRKNLSCYQAIGGVTVSAAELPGWWDPEINWCIGLSPPGTILGHPGYYPDTCNLGTDSDILKHHPFTVIDRTDRQLYTTGREDAEWWIQRRLQGDDITVSYKQAVVHTIHPERLTWKYVVRRAEFDGVSSWLRRPSYAAATSIPWDLAHIAGIVFDKIAANPTHRKSWVAHYIWMKRQWGFFKAVWQSPVNQRPRHRELVRELGRATAFQLKIRTGRVAFNIFKSLRNTPTFPVSSPTRIFVSADCLVGDSILLRPHLQTLAESFPHAEILVSARYPQLLTGLAVNIKICTSTAASEIIAENPKQFSAAIIPYFHHGNAQLWRKSLSNVGSTFDCDVGFSGRRDYIYARRLVPKNLELHEHENLARLFRIWPLRPFRYIDGPLIESHHLEWLDKTLKQLSISDPYTLVQFGAGFAAKEWPLDCWIPFLKKFGAETGSPIIIIGSDNWSEAGEIASTETRNAAQVHSLVGKTNLEQIMALVSRASYFIGGCSGPKHLAIDYNVPTFTLYTATEPHRWGASRDHELHAYVTALKQKLTGMELHGLRDDHRPRLLNPDDVAEKALHHYKKVMRRELISDAPAGLS